MLFSEPSSTSPDIILNERDSAEGNADAQSRLSNTATNLPSKSNQNSNKKPKRLLRFGLDWLTLNIQATGNSPCYNFLANLFDQFDPDGPFDTERDVQWIGTNILFNVQFKAARGDLFAYVKQEKGSYMTIHKITPSTTMQGLHVGDYRIKFYGAFFASVYEGVFKLEEFIQPFLEDEKNDLIAVRVCEVHICCDIENATTEWVDRGIKRTSKRLKKTISRLYRDLETNLYETISFGTKAKKTRGKYAVTDWFVRMYNKPKQIADEGLEWLYPSYRGRECITRTEAVFHSVIFRKYKFPLSYCLDQSALFALFAQYLRSRDVTFKVVDFVENEIQDGSLREVELERINRIPIPLTQEQKVRNLKSSIHTVATAFGVSNIELLEELLNDANGEPSPLLL